MQQKRFIFSISRRNIFMYSKNNWSRSYIWNQKSGYFKAGIIILAMLFTMFLLKNRVRIRISFPSMSPLGLYDVIRTCVALNGSGYQLTFYQCEVLLRCILWICACFTPEGGFHWLRETPKVVPPQTNVYSKKLRTLREPLIMALIHYDSIEDGQNETTWFYSPSDFLT